MNMLVSLCVLMSSIPMTPASAGKPDVPVVLWQVRFIYVADAVAQAGDAVKNRDKRATVDTALHASTTGTSGPPSTTKDWPEWLALCDNKDSCERAVVEIIEDDKTVQIEDLSFRLRSKGPALLKDGRETSLSREDRIRVSAAPYIRTFADGRGSEFCQTGPFNLSRVQETPKSHQFRKDWMQEGVYVAADSVNGDAVSIQDLVIGRRVIGDAERRPSSPTGEWYPLLVEQRLGASLWLSPRQTAVLRMPRDNNDRGCMTVFVRVSLADEINTRELNSYRPAPKESASRPVSGLLPLLEKP